MQTTAVLKTVCTWDNGLTIVFDAAGQQVPELQGRIDELRDAILAAANEGTEFRVGSYRNGTWEVTPDAWFSWRGYTVRE